jgi:hypothetical protein
MNADVDRLGEGKYLLLTSFRKDGTPIPTPVWVVSDGDQLYAWSAVDTGKVKRIRRDGKVELGPCDFRGTPTGDSIPGRATLLDAEDSDRVRDLIAGKYGIAGKLTLFGSKIRRGKKGSIGIAIMPST